MDFLTVVVALFFLERRVDDDMVQQKRLIESLNARNETVVSRNKVFDGKL